MARDYSTVHNGSRPYNSTEPSGFEEMCRHGWPTCPTCDALYNDWRWHLGRALWLLKKKFRGGGDGA